MDVVFLSRVQFALTIMFHYLFPPLTIGLSVVLVYLDGQWLRTGEPIYEKAAKFWTRIFALNFALAVANIPRALHRGWPGYAFVTSCCVIAFMCLLSVALFPNLVTSRIDPEQNSLTVFNAASSRKTLEIMLLIAALGLPFVLAYTAIVYRTFLGKVRLDPHSY